MSIKINHSCERCGKNRQVPRAKIARGMCLVCRECNGRVSAEKRQQAIIQAQKTGRRHYEICRQCGNEFWFTLQQDGEYCSEPCMTKAKLNIMPNQEITPNPDI